MTESYKSFYLKTLKAFNINGYYAMGFFFNHSNYIRTKYSNNSNEKNKRLVYLYTISDDKFYHFVNLLCKIAYYSEDDYVLKVYNQFSNSDFHLAKAFLELVYNHDFITWSEQRLRSEKII